MSYYDLEYISTPGKTRVLGVAFPMRHNGVGGVVTANENLGSLRDGIIQLLMTRKGARVMRPNFGTDLRAAMFEPLDTQLVETLRAQITKAITVYEPRVILKSLHLVPDYEKNTLYIKLSMSSKDDLLNTETVELLI
tara:strand:+ start:324 stop:734 length:411 start_codon:yes stop_codon:yes gene_type:complete